MTELTRYTFLVKTDEIGGGRNGMDPSYAKWVRRFDSDAQAELLARRISEDRRGAWVKISGPMRHGVSGLNTTEATMANRAAIMTNQQIREAGYSVSKSANIGSSDHAKRPWIIQRNSPASLVLDRYESRGAAVLALHTELTDPDGVLR